MQRAVVEVVPCAFHLSVSRLTCCLSTTSAACASGDSRFSVTVMIDTPLALQMSTMGSSSFVLPPRGGEDHYITLLQKPVAPWTASAGEINRAGRSMQHMRCAKCWQMMPEWPQPAAPCAGPAPADAPRAKMRPRQSSPSFPECTALRCHTRPLPPEWIPLSQNIPPEICSANSVTQILFAFKRFHFVIR